MQAQSVRALKEECFEQVIRPRLEAARRTLGFGLQTRSLARNAGPSAAVALGLAPGRAPGDFRLAARLQRRLPAPEDLAEALRTRAAGEIDLRYVGRIAKSDEVAELPWQRTRTRPLRIGLSVGHSRVTAGTLGAFVTPRGGGSLQLLSNNHVLALENRARPGDPILQPGTYDGGRRGDVVARLAGFVALRNSGSNSVDAAAAELVRGVQADPAGLDRFGRLRGLQEGPLLPGQRVRKIGRTTGYTTGTVTATELDGLVIEFELGSLAFDGQFEIEGDGDQAFSEGGDSGSLIVAEADSSGCGLLFAGSDQGGSNGQGLTYANELRPVLDQLEVELAVGPAAA